MTTRREFLRRAGFGAAVVVVARRAVAQQQGRIHDSVAMRDTTNLFAMDQSAARPVALPPKPGAKPSMSNAERDELEHHIHCQCGCTLDVFTCRTTDFSCQVSPAMHRDVVTLVDGGYSAQEIIDAFVGVYGERALMAPKKSGFNLLAWFAPSVAVLAGGIGLAMLLRKWGTRRVVGETRRGAAIHPLPGVDATPEELARLEAAVRGDGDA